MAKITIEIDTHDDLDDRDNALLAVLGQHMKVVKALSPEALKENLAVTKDAIAAYDAGKEDRAALAAEPAPVRKGRAKAAVAAMEAGNKAVSDALFGAPPRDNENAAASANGADVTLPMINNLLVQLLAPGSGHNAEELTEIVKEITNDEAISPKHCDPKYWPEIHARFTALAAAG